MPWRRERLATPVFWPGEFHALYWTVSVMGSQRVGHDWVTFTSLSQSIGGNVEMLQSGRLESLARAMTPAAVTFRPWTVLPWPQFLPRGQSFHHLLCPCNLRVLMAPSVVFSQNNSFCELFSGLPPCPLFGCQSLHYPCNLFPVLKLLFNEYSGGFCFLVRFWQKQRSWWNSLFSRWTETLGHGFPALHGLLS